MTDLTKNTSAFGLMDEADQYALMALPIAQVEMLDEHGWVQKVTFGFSKRVTYRQRPEPAIETRKGKCFGAIWGNLCPTLDDDNRRLDGTGTSGTYHQTTIDNKPVYITWVADGYTPTITDEQAKKVVRILTTLERIEISKADIKWVNRLFGAFVKAGVV